MRCTVLTDNLKKALSLSERNTGKDLTLPILGSLLITAENGLLKIIATNLEIGIEISLRANISSPGKVVIPAKTLTSFISTLPKDEKISLEVEKNDLYVGTESGRTLFKGYPQDDFPPFPVMKGSYKISFNKKDILRVFSKSLISISKNSIKPELASIYISLEKENVRIASTDSFRLSEEIIKPVSLSSKGGEENFLLPLRTTEEIIKLLDFGEKEEILFDVGKGEITVIYDDIRLYSRLTEGSFPNYGQIIPKKFETKITISKTDFIGHIRRASLFTNKLQGISFSFNSDKKTCSIESNNISVGEYKADIPIDIDGEGLSIVFNYHYFLDGLESFTDEKIMFGFNGESQPLLVRPLKNEKSLYVVMPMKGVI
ncbi:MAG: DNA polymerase III subunit beta [bacterium]|nr:DNA polymerase III subunit beta [bacterium]